jgi:hypothetical protein
VGDIIQESRATSSHYTRATSSESADKGALVYDIDSDEVFFSADEEAYKSAYVAVFQAWAKGTIRGTAEQVFDATKSILED